MRAYIFTFLFWKFKALKNVKEGIDRNNRILSDGTILYFFTTEQT